MGEKIGWGLVAVLSCIAIYLAYRLFDGYDDTPKRVCIPLYDQTGLECCQ